MEAGVRDDLGQRAERCACSRTPSVAVVAAGWGRPGCARLRESAGSCRQDRSGPRWLPSARNYDDQDSLAISAVIAELDGIEPSDEPVDDELEIMDVEVVEDDHDHLPVEPGQGSNAEEEQ